MSEQESETIERMRRWWVKLPLDHPFVRVIRQLTGDLPDELSGQVRQRSGRPRERRNGGPGP